MEPEVRKTRKKRKIPKQPNPVPDSELVEKDGEQVFRVKKRRRRTQQRKYQAEKDASRKLLKFLFTMVGLVVALAITLICLLVWVNGNAYEKEVETSLGEYFGGNVEIAGLAVGLNSVSISSLNLEGEEGALLKEVSFDELSGKHHSYGLIGGAWTGPELSVKYASLVIDVSGKLVKGEALEPKINFGSYRAENSQLTFLQNGKYWKFEGGSLVCRETEFLVYDSKSNWFGLGDVQVDTMRMLLDESSELYAKLRVKGGGEARLKGVFGDGGINLSGSVTSLDVENACPSVVSIINGGGKFTDMHYSGPLHEINFKGIWRKGDFELKLPGLDELANRIWLRDKADEPFTFSGVIEVVRSGQSQKLKNIELKSIQGARLRGNASFEAKNGVASFELGVPKGWKDRLERDPDLLRIFTKTEGGYIWTSLKVNILGDVVRDDLLLRLHGAKFKQIDDTLKKKLESQLQNLLNDT